MAKMHRYCYLLVIRAFSDQTNQYYVWKCRIGENANLTHFHVILPGICLSGESKNILITNYGKFSSSLEVWEVFC